MDNAQFRLCSFEIGKDYKLEEYIKIMFPDLKNTRFIGASLNSVERQSDNINRPGQLITLGLSEFSYHFRTGVRHFKYNNQPINQEKDLPTLPADKALHLLSFNVYGLQSFKPYNKHFNDSLQIIEGFSGKARCFNFYILENIDEINVNFVDSNLKPVHVYRYDLAADSKISLLITDNVYMKKQKEAKGVSFFYFNNPLAPLTKPKGLG